MEDRVSVFDTTLRDGEQSPGCSMNLDEKVRMAKQLEALGVDIIEAGFPVASQGDFDAVKAVSESVSDPVVAGLCRSISGDIDRAWQAIAGARHPRLHVFLATSDIHLKHKLMKSRQEALASAVEAVKHAVSLCRDVEFSCEDASRSDVGFLSEVVSAAIQAGATIINLPDTVGYSTPDEYGGMFREILKRVPSSRSITLSAHCHNDLGMAVANSLAAISAGARQVECTINGIGERAGNAALEEIVMALKTRREHFGISTGIRTEEIMKSSHLLSSITGMHVQRNKAITGSNAFSHEAGIHQDGMLKSAITYEIMTPQSVGIRHSVLVLGKHSGRHAVKKRYQELGYNLAGEELERAYGLVMELADKKKQIFDEDLIAILDSRPEDDSSVYHLESIQVHSGTGIVPTATVGLRLDERRYVDSATGDGPVDAAYKAIERITGFSGTLTEYVITSVGSGRDALGEVFVRVEFGGTVFNGRAINTDIVDGSARAYLEALNRAFVARKRAAEKERSPNVETHEVEA